MYGYMNASIDLLCIFPPPTHLLTNPPTYLHTHTRTHTSHTHLVSTEQHSMFACVSAFCVCVCVRACVPTCARACACVSVFPYAHAYLVDSDLPPIFQWPYVYLASHLSITTCVSSWLSHMSHVSIRYESCLYQISPVTSFRVHRLSYMSHISILYESCLYLIWVMSLSYMSHVSIVYESCLYLTSSWLGPTCFQLPQINPPKTTPRTML